MGGGSPGPGSTDAWLTLAALGRETTRIRLGTLVTPVTFRLPGPLAISVAQADAMSGGRIELGLGAGWYGAEHTAYGIPFPPTGTRFEMLEEQLDDPRRHVDHPGWRDVHVRRHALPGRRVARAAEARATSASADHHRRRRSRSARRAWRRGSRTSSTSPFQPVAAFRDASRPRARRVREARTRPVERAVHRRAGRVHRP